jgi:hypothetical protein
MMASGDRFNILSLAATMQLLYDGGRAVAKMNLTWLCGIPQLAVITKRKAINSGLEAEGVRVARTFCPFTPLRGHHAASLLGRRPRGATGASRTDTFEAEGLTGATAKKDGAGCASQMAAKERRLAFRSKPTEVGS